MVKKISHDSFVERAEMVHGGKYIYDDMYTSMSIKWENEWDMIKK